MACKPQYKGIRFETEEALKQHLLKEARQEIFDRKVKPTSRRKPFNVEKAYVNLIKPLDALDTAYLAVEASAPMSSLVIEDAIAPHLDSIPKIKDKWNTEVVTPLSTSVTMNNFFHGLYYFSGRTFKEVFQNKNLLSLNAIDGVARLNLDNAQKFFNNFSNGIDNYLDGLQKIKYVSTEAVQREINDLVIEAKYAKNYYRRYAQGENVWETMPSPAFSLISGFEQQLQQLKENTINDGSFMRAPNGNRTNLTERQWLQVRTPQFINWFGDWINDPQNASKIVDENGEPKVVFHGSTHDFNEFRGESLGNVEGYYGATNYFTTSYSDASTNYGEYGADLQNRVGTRTEQLVDYLYDEHLMFDEDYFTDDFNLTQDDIDELFPYGIPEELDGDDIERISEFIAERELVGEDEQVYDVFINARNPLDLDKNPFIENFEIDEDYRQEAAEAVAEMYDITVEEALDNYEGEIFDDLISRGLVESKVVKALEKAAYEVGYSNAYVYELIDHVIFETEVDLRDVEKAVRDNLYENDEGEYAVGNLLMEFYKQLGYDAVIINANKQFPNLMRGFESTEHIHVAGSNNHNIKSADENLGSFSPETSNIYQQVISETSEMQNIKQTAIRDRSFMKAPNGKPTNLNEKQWLQVRTKAFKDWFGDWENDPKNASKVVDANGEPLVVYHGTDAEFNKFEPTEPNFYSITEGTYFFTDNKKVAANFGKNVKPVYLNIDNPTILDGRSAGRFNTWHLNDDSGNYGWIVENSDTGGGIATEYAVENPNQIKSATSNLGTFSQDTGNIYMQSLRQSTDLLEVKNVSQAIPNLSQVQKENLDSLMESVDNTISKRLGITPQQYKEKVRYFKSTKDTLDKQTLIELNVLYPELISGQRSFDNPLFQPNQNHKNLLEKNPKIKKLGFEETDTNRWSAKYLSQTEEGRKILNQAKTVEEAESLMQQRFALIGEEVKTSNKYFLTNIPDALIESKLASDEAQIDAQVRATWEHIRDNKEEQIQERQKIQRENAMLNYEMLKNASHYSIGFRLLLLENLLGRDIVYDKNTDKISNTVRDNQTISAVPILNEAFLAKTEESSSMSANQVMHDYYYEAANFKGSKVDIAEYADNVHQETELGTWYKFHGEQDLDRFHRMSNLSSPYPGGWCTSEYKTARGYLTGDSSSDIYIFYSKEENNPTLQLWVKHNSAVEIGGLARGQDFRNEEDFRVFQEFMESNPSIDLGKLRNYLEYKKSVLKLRNLQNKGRSLDLTYDEWDAIHSGEKYYKDTTNWLEEAKEDIPNWYFAEKYNIPEDDLVSVVNEKLITDDEYTKVLQVLSRGGYYTGRRIDFGRRDLPDGFVFRSIRDVVVSEADAVGGVTFEGEGEVIYHPYRYSKYINTIKPVLFKNEGKASMIVSHPDELGMKINQPLTFYNKGGVKITHIHEGGIYGDIVVDTTGMVDISGGHIDGEISIKTEEEVYIDGNLQKKIAVQSVRNIVIDSASIPSGSTIESESFIELQSYNFDRGRVEDRVSIKSPTVDFRGTFVITGAAKIEAGRYVSFKDTFIDEDGKVNIIFEDGNGWLEAFPTRIDGELHIENGQVVNKFDSIINGTYTHFDPEGNIDLSNVKYLRGGVEIYGAKIVTLPAISDTENGGGKIIVHGGETVTTPIRVQSDLLIDIETHDVLYNDFSGYNINSESPYSINISGHHTAVWLRDRDTVGSRVIINTTDGSIINQDNYGSKDGHYIQRGEYYQEGGRGMYVQRGEESFTVFGKHSDLTTAIHEKAHEYEQFLTNDEIKIVEEWSGYKHGTAEFSEAFAKGAERVVYEGSFETMPTRLGQIFRQFADWFKQLIEDAISYFGDINELNDEVRDVYAKMFFENELLDNIESLEKSAERGVLATSEDYYQTTEEMESVRPSLAEKRDTTLTENQWLAVKTKSFKDWFGNWETTNEENSIAVNKKNEPVPVYLASRDIVSAEDVTLLENAGKESWIAFTTTKPTVVDGIEPIAYFVNVRNTSGENLDGVGSVEKGYFVVTNPNQVKNSRTLLAPIAGETDFHIIGKRGAERMDNVNSVQNRIQRLAEAEIAEKQGFNPITIKRMTGWERGAEGKWMMEENPVEFDLDKARARMAKTKGKRIINPGKVVDFIKDSPAKEDFITAYPSILDFELILDPKAKTENTRGTYSRLGKKITIHLRGDAIQKTFIHELQHHVQYAENFDIALWGGDWGSTDLNSPEFKRYQKALAALYNVTPLGILHVDSYRRLMKFVEAHPEHQQRVDEFLNAQRAAIKHLDYHSRYLATVHEVGARNAATRSEMSMEERRRTLFALTEDVDRFSNISETGMVTRAIDNITKTFSQETQANLFDMGKPSDVFKEPNTPSNILGYVTDENVVLNEEMVSMDMPMSSLGFVLAGAVRRIDRDFYITMAESILGNDLLMDVVRKDPTYDFLNNEDRIIDMAIASLLEQHMDEIPALKEILGIELSTAISSMTFKDFLDTLSQADFGTASNGFTLPTAWGTSGVNLSVSEYTKYAVNALMDFLPQSITNEVESNIAQFYPTIRTEDTSTRAGELFMIAPVDVKNIIEVMEEMGDLVVEGLTKDDIINNILRSYVANVYKLISDITFGNRTLGILNASEEIGRRKAGMKAILATIVANDVNADLNNITAFDIEYDTEYVTDSLSKIETAADLAAVLDGIAAYNAMFPNSPLWFEGIATINNEKFVVASQNEFSTGEEVSHDQMMEALAANGINITNDLWTYSNERVTFSNVGVENVFRDTNGNINFSKASVRIKEGVAKPMDLDITSRKSFIDLVNSEKVAKFDTETLENC